MRVTGVVVMIALLFVAVLVQGYNWINGNSKITAGTVIASWSPNSEPDLAGYNIYYGNQTLNYTTTINVGNVTEYTVLDLERGRSYYFALTAYDTANNESGYSDEVSIYLSKDDTNIVNINFEYYNFPNPFNPNIEHTFIRYLLQESKLVTIVIYDHTEQVVRRLVTDALELPGEHVDAWDGRDESGIMVANGVYYAVIQLDGERRVVQIAVVK